MTEQRHKESIQKLVEHPENNACAECFRPNPSYASTSLGLFLCPICAKLHQKCIPDLSDVVSILSHRWTKEEVDFLYTEGNKSANSKYEKLLPIYYHRPRPDDPEILFEQWIMAKYVREEFKDFSQQSAYNQGTKTGALFKRLKDQEKFQRRKFILIEPEGKLQYFIKYSDKNPKDNIHMKNMVNVYLVPEKVGNEGGMQITYEKDGVRRNIYVFGEDMKTTTDWYHAIRASMARHKYKDFPDSDVRRYLNTTIIMEGWMSKTGPKKHEKFRRRWFSLIGTAIWYYAQPLDAHPLGYIALGSKTFGYSIMRGFPKGIREEGYGLTIHTPDRVYVLNCVNMDSREQWMSHVEKVLLSCTNVWTKPSIAKVGNIAEKSSSIDKSDDDSSTKQNRSEFKEISSGKQDSVINLDEIDDLDTPSATTVFTGMHNRFVAENASIQLPDIQEKTESRKPLFQKNTSGHKDGKIVTKMNKDTKQRKGTVKANPSVSSVAPTPRPRSSTGEMRKPSKKYSDDSESTGSDSDEDIVASSVVSPLPKQTQRLIVDGNDRRRFLSSATDEDSEEEIIILRNKDKNLDGSISRHKASVEDTNNRFSFPMASQGKASTRLRSPGKRPQSPLTRPRSTLADDSDSISSTSSEDVKSVNIVPINKKQFHFSQETLNSTLSAAMPGLGIIDSSSSAFIDDEGNANLSSEFLLIPENQKWRSDTFTSLRRVQGKERKTLKKPSANSSRLGSVSSVDSQSGISQDIKERPVSLTIVNNLESAIWFLVFQCEEEISDENSYITPWIGAEIAEMPASVGPIQLPCEFEIAIIDTAPGGYGLRRTTGPFYTEYGDIWEVDMPVDDGSAPDMFFHEGMETDDGSVMVYSNVENSKQFEIAMFKSGRKLFSRKNIKPGDAVSFKVEPVIYVMPVDQESYYEMEGEDIRLNEIISRASKIDLDYRKSKLKISAKKRGDDIYFSR
uniref:uncharacterized protein LOC120340811 n=1 Tax=Styela clava TaxID=7725 RepID=UPI00193A1D0F|nr:uncharacterized protein LOC120340811 [Styela clava]